jgi:hypothetical protein
MGKFEIVIENDLNVKIGGRFCTGFPDFDDDTSDWLTLILANMCRTQVQDTFTAFKNDDDEGLKAFDKAKDLVYGDLGSVIRKECGKTLVKRRT